MSRIDGEDLDAALALLAEGLRGALEVHRASGATWIPRVRPQSALPQAVPAPVATPAPQPEAPLAAAKKLAKGLPVLLPDAPFDETDAAIRAILESDALSPEEKLDHLKHGVIGACRRCKLHRGRTNVAFGIGNPHAALCFVGEGPGAEEDRQGIPFVGAAGQLLTKMIAAMGFDREEVYICNVVKCRPPRNRDPEPDEVEACERFLKAQLAIVRPKAIVTLGRHAAQTLLRTTRPISKLRGQWFHYEGIDLLPTYHPAYLLRSPEKKREAWEDLKKVMAAFGKGS